MNKKGNAAIGVIVIIVLVFIVVLILVDFATRDNINATGRVARNSINCGEGFYLDNGFCREIPVREKVVEKVVYVPSGKTYNPVGIALIIGISIVIASFILRYKRNNVIGAVK